MISILSWIPMIGPIIEGVISVFNKKMDTEVINRQTDADVKKAEIVASTQALIAFKDDINVRITRDIILFPVAVWTALIVWDKIVDIRYPWLVWGVSPLTEASGLAYLPYAVMVFLFGMAGMNSWKRK